MLDVYGRRLASPHLAALTEFRWKEQTTYGKAIRKELLSPVSVLYFIILDLDTVSLKEIGCLVISEFGENSDKHFVGR